MGHRARVLATAAVAAGLASAAYASLREARDYRRFPPPGRFVTIGGRRLHLWCAGEGSPAVVIIPALGGCGTDWAGVQQALQPVPAVCLVDRPGLGWSDPDRRPRDIGRLVDELHLVLQAAPDLQPPYLLVGHSLGGLVARLYCGRYRDHAAGLLLVDSCHEDQMRLLPQPFPGAERLHFLWKAARLRAQPLGLVRLARDLGIDASAQRLAELRPGAPSTLPDGLAQASAALSMSSRTRRALIQELVGFAAWRLGEIRREARDLDDLPVCVLTGGARDREWMHKEWLGLQQEFLGLSTRATQQFAPHTGHMIHIDDPDLVVQAIRDLVRRVRSR